MIAPQQNNASKRPPKKQGGRVSLAALVVALSLIVGIAAFFVLHDNTPAQSDQRPIRRAKIDPAQRTVKPRHRQQPSVEAQNPNKRYEDGVEVVKFVVSTNSSGAVIEKITLADGRKISKVHPPKPVFENPADQVIAIAVSVKPGESMPPLPDLTGIDDDFAKSLLSPVKINDDDTDDIKELKAKVIEAKAYLVDDVKNGGSVLDALLTHQKEMERIADSRLMAIQEMQKLQTGGDTEMAHDFAERVNESFRARGIPEIPVPGAKR